MPQDDQSIVVTGLGVVSALGIGIERFHEGLRAGRSGITPIEVPWETGYEVNRAGIVTDFGLPEFKVGHVGKSGRAARFARAACRMALEQAGALQTDRCGRMAVIVGTTWGEPLELEHDLQSHSADGTESGSRPNRHPFCRLAGDLGTELGLDGPEFVVSTTCAAGNHSISLASDLIRSGAADSALAVGVDALAYLVLLGFSRLLLQSPDLCQPFDLNRKGTILGEGAGALLLERADRARSREAGILAEVAGCGLSCDAAGPFESNAEDVRSLHVAAAQALREAECDPTDIDYVSAHGSATILNDRKETIFLKSLLGDHAYRVPVSSIKSMIGHAQAAASSLEAVACVLSLQHDVLYPTINLDTPDPACDLDYIANTFRERRVDTILSNAFGLGGNNAIVIFRRWADP